MSYNEVFLSLKEFFPMVDDRILKAVAIEHYKNDVEVAADYIVSQVLPSLRRLPVPRAETCCRRHPDEGKLSCVSIEHTTAKAVQKDVGITVHAVPTLLEQKEPCTEESPDFVEFGAREEKYASSSGCDYEESRNFLIENNCEEVAVDDKFCAARITRSSQILNTELLEDFVNDAKNSKNTLIRAMESVVGLLQEVECREKEATQAKDAAGKAGLDILAKVEDLKQLLMHSKEANDMHAGEVYGEKSVLATEARELQSRLFILADERDKSLSVLEDMESKRHAENAEALLLGVFDYAWNRRTNGSCRRDDVLLKLKSMVLPNNLFDIVVRELHFFKIQVFNRKRVGMQVESGETHKDLAISDSIDSNQTIKNDSRVCGVTKSNGSICENKPVSERKRCADHKGKRINKSTLLSTAKESSFALEKVSRDYVGLNSRPLSIVCGIILEDGSICMKLPYKGRKRCESHKGRRIIKPKSPNLAE